MSETTGTPALNKALAELQADLPQIIKDAQADVPGKEGKRGYSYKYADLATVSAEVLPKLGARGLAFTSRPTLVDGQFGLLYELLHESGESMGGFYPLPGQGTPQTIGSAITYARRYCLCAVTGTAPAEDDDDAQAANGQSVQMSRQSAGDAWDSAQPARTGQPAQRNSNGGGKVSRPSAAPERPAQPPADDGLLGTWAAKIDEIASQEDAGNADAELKQVFKDGKIDATRANAIRRAIRDKAQSLAGASA